MGRNGEMKVSGTGRLKEKGGKGKGRGQGKRKGKKGNEKG